jgi:hypothetical protein
MVVLHRCLSRSRHGIALAFALRLAEPSPLAAAVQPLGTNFEITAEAGADAIGGRPAIAADGSNFLVVWRDQRNAGSSLLDVYGARVAHDGTVVDPGGIPISTGPGTLQVTATPSVAFDGTNYLVVWVGTVPPANATNEIFAAVVGTDGKVAATDLQVSIGGDPRPRPIGISWNGENYLVVWRTNSDAIRGLFVTAAGTAVGDPAGFSIGGGFYPSATWNGAHHLVCWHANDANGWGVHAARVQSDGTVLEPGGFLVADPPLNQDHCSVASDGDGFLLAWHDWRPDGSEFLSTAYAARVSAQGAVLDATPIQVATRARGQTSPPVVFDGANYLVAWMEENEPARFRLTDVYARRISPAGALVDTESIPVAHAYGHQFGPVLGNDAAHSLVAWNESGSDGRCPSGCIWGQILEQVADPPPALLAARHAGEAAPAQTGRGAAEWTPVPSGAGNDVRINRIGGSDSSHAYAATGVGSGSQNPLLRFDGTTWSVWLAGPFRGRQFGQWVAGPDDVWTTGWCGDTFHYDGGTLASTNCLGFQLGTGLFGGTPGELLLVSADGDAGRLTGLSYQPLATGVDVGLWDVWGTSSTDALAVGEFGTVLRWNGTDWTPESAEVPTRHSLNAVWGSGPDDVFAVGDSGVALRYDGQEWTQQSTGSTQHLFGVWGSGPTDVWAVGFGGTILHYDGASWSPSASGTTEELLAIGNAGVDLWVGGDGGLVLHRNVGLFADDFEDQSTCAWSATVGGSACD